MYQCSIISLGEHSPTIAGPHLLHYYFVEKKSPLRQTVFVTSKIFYPINSLLIMMMTTAEKSVLGLRVRKPSVNKWLHYFCSLT